MRENKRAKRAAGLKDFSLASFNCNFFRELLTNVLDMVSVLISVVSNAEGTHGQSAEESRKAAFALFKKLKVYDCFKAVQVRSIFIFQRSFTI